MKEVFEEIIERLEEVQKTMLEAYETSTWITNKICFHYSASAYGNAISIVNQVAEEYKDKYVSIGVYKQVAWERDIAINQLHELGYEFGQKIDVPETNVGKNGGWIPCSGCKDCQHKECEHYGKV